MELNKKIVAIIIILYAATAFLNLGKMYLRHEEPRRAIIALEMNYTHNYIAPTVLGRNYYKKPPLHNIIIAIFFKIFGVNESSARLISVLSMFGIALLIFLAIKEIVGFEAAVFAALGFATSYIALIQYGMLAETDMFFSLLVFASMLCIFYDRILLGSFLTALALLTKGFPALHYFYLTLFGWYIYKKQPKKIFSKRVIGGGIIILSIFFGWLLLLSKGDIHRFNLALGFLLQASGSRVESIQHIFESLKHLIIFPISFFIHGLPASIVFLFFLNSDFRANFKESITSNSKISSLFYFSVISFVVNFLIYAIIPDGRVRYTLPLFGITALIYGIIFYVYEFNEAVNAKKYSLYVLYFFIAVFAVALLFDLEFLKTPSIMEISLALVISFLFIVLIKKTQSNSLNLLYCVVASGLLLKLAYAATYESYLYTYYTNYRGIASKMAKIILHNNPRYVMTDGGNLRLFFYLERDLKMQLHPIKNGKNGIIITRNPKRVKTVINSFSLPDHIYYIGKN
ncbi:ArnT family glycosyltransferase [Hippea jasoniae]|uniref:ArnT family glycosyltransferase n=1 Tax=Hippea jasoniae TaxID=944479 RepID=UPI00055944F2|nr:glycosyltransferase family 39 protein [Hippea jasoniae]